MKLDIESRLFPPGGQNVPRESDGEQWEGEGFPLEQWLEHKEEQSF